MSSLAGVGIFEAASAASDAIKSFIEPRARCLGTAVALPLIGVVNLVALPIIGGLGFLGGLCLFNQEKVEVSARVGCAGIISPIYCIIGMVKNLAGIIKPSFAPTDKSLLMSTHLLVTIDAVKEIMKA